MDSQEKFIAILCLCNNNPTQIFDLIRAAQFPANLFLKHLIVLADYGAETLQRLNKNFSDIFDKSEEEDNKYFMRSSWRGENFKYVFKDLPVPGNLNNKKLGIDGTNIAKKQELDSLKEDIIMLLLYGSNIDNANGADLEKCEIGSLLGKEDKLELYIKQKYILVSRITGGATSNTQGQIAQKLVIKYLEISLNETYKIISNGKIKLENYNKKTGMPFDILIKKGDKAVGIEISFQVTTNSVIERKAGQAQERQKLMHDMGYKIAYVIGGAGNFHRRSAVSTICRFSDCTVSYSKEEFKILAQFVRDSLND